MYKYDEIVKTFIIEDIICGDYVYKYKIEVYKNQEGLYYSRFFRLDCFDLISISDDKKITSELIYIRDDFLTITKKHSCSSVKDSLYYALSKLKEFYSRRASMK